MLSVTQAEHKVTGWGREYLFRILGESGWRGDPNQGLGGYSLTRVIAPRAYTCLI
ncbi:MAG: hypothetical protein KatS3mg114_0067 [Planctomycetaceae bacterium]|nr:MAG: hypothetical protein KatS3mg114_0067 [Planctomycetaceae bacterium]